MEPGAPERFPRGIAKQPHLRSPQEAKSLERFRDRFLLARPPRGPLVLIERYERRVILKRDPTGAAAHDHLGVRQMVDDLPDGPFTRCLASCALPGSKPANQGDDLCRCGGCDDERIAILQPLRVGVHEFLLWV